MGKLKNTTAAAMALVEIYNVNRLKHLLTKDPENVKISKKLEDSKRTFAVLAMEGFDEATLSKLIGEPIDAETVSE